MKIVLVNPPAPTAEVTKYLRIAAPPMGLAYLAAVLERDGHSVSIIDVEALSLGPSQLRAKLEEENPDLIGVTALTPTIQTAMAVTRIGKEACPGAFTVMGGTHPSFLPLETLRDCRQLDAVCVGEGEGTMVELARTLERKGDLASVRGICYRTKDGAAKNPQRPLIEDLDELPFPARHLLPMDRYTVLGKKFRMAIVTSSRGCPFNCIYCSSSRIFGKKFRARSAKNTVDEIEHVVEKYGVRSIEFSDDMFTLLRKRVEGICQEIKGRHLDISWACSSRVDTVSKDLLEKMKDAGCGLIFYGIESGSKRILDLMNKGISIEQITRAIKWTREAGIEAYGSFILGFPGETREELETTIKFARELDLDMAEFNLITAFPGSDLFEVVKREGLLITEDWSQYTAGRPNVINREIPAAELAKYLGRAYTSFYLSPPVILHHLLKGRAHMVKKIVIETLKSKLGLLKGTEEQEWNVECAKFKVRL
jgi:anaerobic magnesium-protoporphyrin IX monomethyl ester cyclase